MSSARPGPGAQCPRALEHLDGGPWRFHLVGAGGSGMNAIAAVLLALGHRVSGSDEKSSAALDRLAKAGATVWAGHEPARIHGTDAVAFSTAVPVTDPELAEARRLGIPVCTRADVLAAICGLRRCVAVSGTHGKTTTTAMLARILEGSGLSPSYIVGGELAGGEGGAKWADGDLFVVEADESDGTFLRLPAYAVLVTSVDADHMDYFGDLATLEEAFDRFASAPDGPKVLCTSNPGSAALARRLAASGLPELVTYGGTPAHGEIPGPTFEVTGVVLDGFTSSFDLTARGVSMGRFDLAVPGLHNVLDAAGAIAMAVELGVPAGLARQALRPFTGVGRRFERKGEAAGVVFVDDYAHNPGKVAALLAAAQATARRRVVVVFQPHRFSRTAALWRELGEALAGADVVVVTDIYAAGEAPLEGVTAQLVVTAARAAHEGPPVYYLGSRAELLENLPKLLEPGDLCLTVGAGDITTLAPELLGSMSSRPKGDDQCPAP